MAVLHASRDTFRRSGAPPDHGLGEPYISYICVWGFEGGILLSYGLRSLLCDTITEEQERISGVNGVSDQGRWYRQYALSYYTTDFH